MPYAVIFPGQGAALPGAGEPWREHLSWAVVEEAEAVLQRPLARLLLEAEAAELATTAASQLAVLLTSLLAWETFSDAIDDERPVAFAGHSLGQMTALLAAGAVGRADGLQLAARRADLTQRSADLHPGRMAALIGVDAATAEQVCEGHEVWVANDNAPGQVVVAGASEELEKMTERALAAGVRRVMPLAVGHAFHTPLLVDAADGLRPLLDELTWTTPEAPVVSNTDGVAYDGAEGWSDRLYRHLVEPVRWQECQRTLAGLGIDTLVEIGPGRVLSGMARRTIPDVRALHAATPAQVSEVVQQLDHPGGRSAVMTGARHSTRSPVLSRTNPLPPPSEDPA